MVQVEVSVDSGEAFDRALARFKKMCGKAGIVTEIKKRSFYEKPSEKRRRIEMKRQRKVKPRRTGERPQYYNGGGGGGGSSGGGNSR
jgi:small subunit ribosomal protein S21